MSERRRMDSEGLAYGTFQAYRHGGSKAAASCYHTRLVSHLSEAPSLMHCHSCNIMFLVKMPER